MENRDGEAVTHNVLTSNYGPVLLLDIVSSSAVVYRYAGHVFGVEQGQQLQTIEQVWAQLTATDESRKRSASDLTSPPPGPP
eukprot:COSAG01_NODE_13958_length_1514_cov_2.732862_2_plen_82_part_00